jgi:hypothetical protein
MRHAVRWATGGVVILGLLVGSGGRVDAESILVDQENLGSPIGGFTVSGPLAYIPSGQEFTPTLSQLNFADFFLNQRDGAPAALQVRVRSGSISGPILGTSQVADVPLVDPNSPPSAGTFVRFEFATSVPLLPGSRNVLELVPLAGTTGPSVGAQETGDQYAGGRAIQAGVPQANFDLIFREGVIVPEPSSLVLAVLSTTILLGYARHRHRRDHA